MLRYFIRNFYRNLNLNHKPNRIIQNHVVQLQNIYRNFQTSFNTDKEETSDIFDALQAEDEAYIVPYDRSDELIQSNSRKLSEYLKTRLLLSNKEIENIINNGSVEVAFKKRNLKKVLDKLLAYGVSKKTILEIPWILALDTRTLDAKFDLLNRLKPRDINDFVPFLSLTVQCLQELIKRFCSDKKFIPESNRIYYISEKLKVDPFTVSKYIYRRLFILEMSFQAFNEKLQNMIEYNVSSNDLLRDLWSFRYKPKSILNRFERVKTAKKRKTMPWMVRCPESILQRSLKLSTDEIEILNGKSSIVEYIAERLNYDVEFTKTIMEKHRAVFSVRARKIKEVLDYLLNEAKFTSHEIAQNPRILCHSLTTTKNRIDELKSYNCRPTSLVIVCRSKREYQKFLNHWIDMQEKNKKPNISETSNNN